MRSRSTTIRESTRARAWALARMIVVGLLAWPRVEARAGEIPRAESEVSMPDIEFTAADGTRRHLSELWDDRPVLVSLFYRRCTGSCSPFLRSLKRAVEAGGGLGTDYAIVSLSFDPGDTTADASAMADALELPSGKSWYVGTADKQSVDAVALAIGFWYSAIPRTDQFDHPSVLAAVRSGRIVQLLAGNASDARRLRDLILEMRGVYVPIAPLAREGSSVRCFRFNEETNELKLDWGVLLLLAPGLGAALATATLFLRRKKRGALLVAGTAGTRKTE